MINPVTLLSKNHWGGNSVIIPDHSVVRSATVILRFRMIGVATSFESYGGEGTNGFLGGVAEWLKALVC